MSETVDRAGLARSSAVVAAGTLLSRVTGLLRVVALAAVLGRGLLADTFNLANSTPNIVYELLLGGVLAATLVPVFVDQLERRDERSIAAVFTVTMTAIVAFTAVAMLGAPLLARMLTLSTSSAKRAAQLHLLTVFVVCFVPQMAFYGFTTLATALLNARRRFVAAAFAPVLNNVVAIGVLLVFAQRTTHLHTGITDGSRIRNDLGLELLLGVGTTAGIVVMALALVPSLLRAGVRLRPVFAWRDPAVRTIVRLSGWTAGYVVTNQIAQLFVLVLANRGESGRVSAFVYAFTFYQVPHGLLAVSIMTAITPELARRAAARDLPGMQRDFTLGLRYIVVLVLPASVLFAVLAQPMLGIIVHGKFTGHDAAITADTLQAFALSLVPFSVYLYTLRAFYALHDTRAPFLLNCLENGLNVALALALYHWLGVQGLALAWGGAYLVAAVVAMVALRRRIGGVPNAAAVRSTGRAAIGALALAAVAIPLAAAVGRSSPSRALAATLIGGGAGLIVYLGVLVSLRSDELRSLVRLVRGTSTSSLDVSP